MSNLRTDLTNNEKFVMDAINTSNVISMKSDKDLDTLVKKEAKLKHNDAVEEMNKRLEEDIQRSEALANKMAEKMNEISIKAPLNKVIVRPYAKNPFQKMQISKSGIITDLGGMTMFGRNPDTGEDEEMDNFIEVAEIVAAGPGCQGTYKEGDVVMYIKQNALPIPLFDWGLKGIYEQHIIIALQ